MICVTLCGGLGNQMFQRAFGLALEARRHKVCYDPSACVPNTHREYSLDGFKQPTILGYPGASNNEVSETSLRFDVLQLHPPDPSVLHGYWQCEKYFEDIKDEVRAAFEFKGPYVLSDSREPVAEIWSDIYRSNSIAVHVRRGDYVNLQHFHGMPDLNYYQRGIEYILSQTRASKVFVFSDDPDWCREAFPKEYRIVKGLTKFEDLRLMAACNHAVIANSSFSWWGAWLGDNQIGRVVVAPKRWFTSDKMDATDIVPERWVKL